MTGNRVGSKKISLSSIKAQKLHNEGARCTSCERKFHSLGAATEKALSQATTPQISEGSEDTKRGPLS